MRSSIRVIIANKTACNKSSINVCLSVHACMYECMYVCVCVYVFVFFSCVCMAIVGYN